ncbi:MAG: MBL fold metallo-hydrolase [Pseudomonadota bacterium]|nr:MBL fold metallo-hydrolase [Pseudomonadota bacterium]
MPTIINHPSVFYHNFYRSKSQQDHDEAGANQRASTCKRCCTISNKHRTRRGTYWRLAYTAALVSGETEVMLVNGFFNQSDALRAAAQILDSGKTLNTIFVSYGDPDFYFGLETLTQIFPHAKIMATSDTIAHIEKTHAGKLSYWSPKMGNNAPKKVIMPQPIQANQLRVDGESIEVRGEGEKTYLWIPSAKAVVGGIPVFAGMHLWMADDPTPADWAVWQQSLQGIQALKPAFVLAGHSTADAATTLTSVDFSQTYLNQYAKANATSKTGAALAKKMQALYPDLAGTANLEMGAKVVKGEMQWP